MRNVNIGVFAVLVIVILVAYAYLRGRTSGDNRPLWQKLLFDPFSIFSSDDKGEDNGEELPSIQPVSSTGQPAGPGIDPDFVAPDNVQKGRVEALTAAFNPFGIDLFGTDEKGVYGVLSSLAGPADFAELIRVWGKRGIPPMNLVDRLRSELNTEEERKRADSILFSVGIKPIIETAKF